MQGERPHFFSIVSFPWAENTTQIILKRFIIKSYGWQLFKLSGNYSSKTKFHFFQNSNFTSSKRDKSFFLQVSYENRNRSLFLLVTFLKMKVFYKWDKKRKCTFSNMSTVIGIEFYDHWLAYRHCFVIDAKIRRVTQGALLRIPADSPDSDFTHFCSEQNIAQGKMCPAPGDGRLRVGWKKI